MVDDLKNATMQYAKVILTSSDVYSIHFKYRNYLVTGPRYSSVVDAINNGHITFRTVSDIATSQGEKKVIEAAFSMTEFNAKANKFVNGEIKVPYDGYGGLPPERAALVHEATHAIAHIYDITGVDEAQREVATHLAAALYCRVGPGTLGIGVEDTEAYNLADYVITNSNRGQTFEVTDAAAKPLLDALRPLYTRQ